ncbi:ATP-binding cassette domain-containing protein [Candidatus Magnetominusculus dajiuhuensis]|uniref:ATP-binding cassette domain-containing protein n=1 Tax=Candidatus Magnetominusculus dajiuhuensis TaxID=3137712 RepID=UPI003B437D01
MSAPYAIEARNLKVVYNEGTPNEVVALDDVCLSVPTGQIIILTGGNGSGKSTLVKAIAGMAPVKSGSVFIHGRDVTGWPAYQRAKHIGFVHQDPMLGTCPNLTVHENFQISLEKPWWWPTPYPLSLTKGQLDSINKIGLPLAEKKTTQLSMLSGGQRQSIALCLALRKGSILLLDEFTSALDEQTKKAVLLYALSEAKTMKATVIMITHDLAMAKELGKELGNVVLTMDKGRFKEATATKEISDGIFRLY